MRIRSKLKGKSEKGKNNLFFSRFTKNAAAVIKKNTERFDCKTKRDVKTYHGPVAVRNAEAGLNFFF